MVIATLSPLTDKTVGKCYVYKGTMCYGHCGPASPPPPPPSTDQCPF